MKNKGLIIYFEGPDGVGKTTQLKLAAAWLRERGNEVHVTRTLGGTHIGEMLRDVILSESERPVETDLYIALACQYALAQDILDRRKNGEIVLIDRSPLSIIGYQVYGDGLNRKVGYKFVGELLAVLQPDLILTYSASDENLQARRYERDHNNHDFFEQKPLSYHQKVARGFRVAAKHFGTKIVKADGSAEAIHEQTMKLIDQLCSQDKSA